MSGETVRLSRTAASGYLPILLGIVCLLPAAPSPASQPATGGLDRGPGVATPQAQEAADQLEKGLRAMEKKAYTEAQQYVRAGLETIRKSPSPEALDSFRDGLQAREERDWKAAVTHFLRAAELRTGDGARVGTWESGRRIVNSRGFGEPYLPRYFAGEALFRDGRRCEEALGEWSKSEEDAAIQRHRGLHDDLVTMREECELER